MIIGIAAAGYLGYDKPDSFRRARTRHPSLAKLEVGRPPCLDTCNSQQLGTASAHHFLIIYSGARLEDVAPPLGHRL